MLCSRALLSSYDYDAPLSEGGSHNYGSDGVDKYTAVRDALAQLYPDDVSEWSLPCVCVRVCVCDSCTNCSVAAAAP